VRAFRTGLVALLSLTLVSSATSGMRPLGLVLQAEGAQLGRIIAQPGTTVFAGDTMITGPAGMLRLRVGTSQVYLRPNTLARLAETESGIRADLERGTVGFSTPGNREETILVRAADVDVRAQTSQPTHGELTLVSDTELLVSCYAGSVDVIVGPELYSVPQGNTYQVSLEQRQDPAGAGAERGRRARRVAAFAVLFGTAVGVTLIVLYNVVSPHIF
jgi:hypothetical protein